VYNDDITLHEIILHYVTLHYSDKCFKKLQSLYKVSNYKRYRTDEFTAGVYKQVAMWLI